MVHLLTAPSTRATKRRSTKLQPTVMAALSRRFWQPLRISTASVAWAGRHCTTQQAAASDVVSGSGDSALHRAIRNRHRDVAHVLLAAGASPHAVDRELDSPLAYAVRFDWCDVVRKLLVAGADPDEYVLRGYNTALLDAIECAYFDVAEELIAHGADVNLQIRRGKSTAMTIAIYRGSVRLVEKLLAAGANVNHVDYYNRTPLIQAANQGHVRIVALLIDSGANVKVVTTDQVRQTALIYAARKGSEPTVDALLQVNGIDVKVVDFDGNTALMHAAGTTSVETVESVHHVNRDGQTALHRAAQHGQVEIVAYLLHLSLFVDQSDRTGRTPLLWASMAGHTEVVELLLATTDVGIEYPELGGYTTLSIAATQCHVGVVEILVSWGANVQSVVRNAYQDNHPSIAARLEAAGADLYH